MRLLEIARLFLFVREASPNAGRFVEAIQRWGGGQKGDSWCAFWVTMVLDLYYRGRTPTPTTGSCQAYLEWAQRTNLIHDTPEAGDLYIRLNDAGKAHHMGFVVATMPYGERRFIGISGNTSVDGQSSNGDGIVETTLRYGPSTVFVRLAELAL